MFTQVIFVPKYVIAPGISNPYVSRFSFKKCEAGFFLLKSGCLDFDKPGYLNHPLAQQVCFHNVIQFLTCSKSDILKNDGYSDG